MSASGGFGLLAGFFGQQQAPPGKTLYNTLHEFMFWVFLFTIVGALAVVTNPTDASFRSYLTELSFRRHLRELHRPSPAAEENDPEDPSSLSHLKDPLPGLPSPDAASLSRSSALNPTGTPSSRARQRSRENNPHLVPFRFANRVSISLRTPQYTLRDFGLFTLVTVPPNHPARVRQDRATKPPSNSSVWSDPDEGESLLAGVWFLGIFGRWWLAGNVRIHEIEKPGPNDVASVVPERAGILDVRALDGPLSSSTATRKKAPEAGPTSPRQPAPVACPSIISRPRSRRSSLDKSIVKPPPPIPDSHAITLHQRPPPPEPTPTPPPKPEADPPLSPSSDSNVPHVDPKLLSTHPALNDLYNSVSASHASATDLRIQFDSLSSAASASQAQLQSTLDDLRARKRDEDADRLDVKTRTKALEEGKRQAEAAKREADKKLKVSEGLRDAVLARIAVLTKQVDEATEKMKVQKGQMAKSREHVQTREKQVKEEMEGKQKRVAEMEETVTNEAGSVKELEELVRKEEDSLEQAKADALEALEMERRRQTAFSPFGVPQPRAVENDYYAQTPMPSIYGPPISTASIFDLPPQQAPVSLLRRRQQTDPVPPTTSYSSSSSALSPPLSNPIAPSHSFSTASNDVFGFDDFGPGIVPNNISRRYAPPPPTTSHHYDPFQTSIAQPSPHARPIPPSLQTSDFQPFTPPSSFPGSLPESEPGSPGLMSASFSTLLPRGLFHSLSHDGGMFSPDLDGAPDSPFTNAYHRASLAESDGDGEQPESRDGSNPIGDKKPKRQSPSEDDGLLFSADEEDSPRGDELQDQVFDLRRQPNARPASDVHLPASPRSVFSDDPRSLLLDPSSDENFSYPPPATESSSTQANGSSTAVTGLFSGLSDYDRSSPETKRNKLYARLQQHAKENSFDSQRATLPDVSKDADGEGDDDDAGKEEKKDEIAASKKDGGKKDDSPSHSKFSAKSWFTSSSSKAASHQEIPPSSSPSSTALTPVSSNPSSLHATSTSASSLVPSLNPDAKAFSFNGPTSASSSSSSSLFHRPVTRSTSNPTRHPAPPHSDLNVTSAPFIPVHSSSLLSSSARNSSESLLLPNGNNVSRSHESSSSPSFNAPSSSSAASPGTGSRFFSSLRAFAPSAAEREALTRALRNPSTTTTSAANHPNASNRSIDTFHSGTAGVDHHRDPPPPASSSPTQASYPYASGRMGTGGGSAKRPGMGLTGSSNGSTVANGSESDLSRAAWDSASVEEGSKRKSSFSRFFPFTRRTTNDNSSTSIDLTSSSSSASTSSRHLPPVSVSTLPPPTPNGTGLNGEWAPSWSERSRKRFSFLDEQQQHQGHASSRGREKEL